MLLILLLSSLAFADEDVPAIVRASPHFTGAIGSGRLIVTATATPTTLTVGESLIFTLSIENVRNPSQVRRLDFDAASFVVENLDAVVDKDRVVFRYRLQPRSRDVTEIPSLRFDYYAPEAVEDKRLRTIYTTPIPLTIRSATASKPAFEVPERFRTRIPERPAPGTPTLLAWIATPLIAIAGAVVWIIGWRRWNPQGARLASLQRNRTVRNAIVALRRTDGDANVVEVLRQYLQQRFHVPANATSSELQEELHRRFDVPAAEPIVQILQDGDAVRFGQTPAEQLAGRAREAILRLEAAT